MRSIKYKTIMEKMKKIVVCVVGMALFFFQCSEDDVLVTPPRPQNQPAAQNQPAPQPAPQNQTPVSAANSHYVSTTGDDASGDGSATHPWKTLKYAVTKVPANQGQTI